MSAAIFRVAEVTKRWNFRVWGFGEAIALRGLLHAGDVTDDPSMSAFVYGVLRTWLGRGVARTNEDHVGAGRELIELYRRTGDDQFLGAALRLAELNASFPRHSSGVSFHRADTPGWRHQVWVDCMDIDGPFLAELAAETGDERYFDQAAAELLGYARTLQSPGGLLYHGFERDCGQNGCLWARGNGWALMGLVDTLAVLPQSHPSWLELQQRLELLVEALASCQDAGGLWHTVLDAPDTYLESTLAAMTAYALRNAFGAGTLDAARFGEMEARARAAMHAATNDAGELQLVSDATPVGALQNYATRPFGVFPWGQGPLLLSLAQEMK